MGNSSSTPTDAHGCPTPEGSLDYGVRGSAWRPMLWSAVSCTVATTLVATSLIVQHLRRYRAPKEQRQIIRITFSIVAYSLISVFELYQYDVARYIHPLGDFYEALGLCALFLLFIQYAAPSGTFDEETFAAVKAREETITNFMWPKISWIFVFQYPAVNLICVITTEASEATDVYCSNSLAPKFAHLWKQILQTVSIGACVIAILRFWGNMKGLMKTKRGIVKLGLFKAVVFLRFIQQWVFSILLTNHAIRPSSQLSYNDILWGISSLLTCAEMVIFAVAFWYAFSASEYSSTAHSGPRIPIYRAVPHVLNPTDLLMGVLRVVPLFLEVRRNGDWDLWQASKKAKRSSKSSRNVRGRRHRYIPMDRRHERHESASPLH